MRPADQIDITEHQLQLLRDVFDSLPRTAVKGLDAVYRVDLFKEFRKNP